MKDRSEIKVRRSRRVLKDAILEVGAEWAGQGELGKQ